MSKPIQDLRSLQNCNQELQQTINQRLQALQIQINITPLTFELIPEHSNQKIVDLIKQKHQEDLNLLSTQLLRQQIQMQEEQEMMQLVKNYEERIGHLRGALINKQAQIVYQTYQRKRQGVARKQNMKHLSLEYQELHVVKKELNIIKTLHFQIEAIEYMLKQLNTSSISRENQTATFQREFTFNKSVKGSIGLAKTTDRARQQLRDGLSAKLLGMLQVQLAKEEQKRKMLTKLDKELYQLSRNHDQLISKYLSLEQQRKKALNASQNARDSQKKIAVNILDELHQSEAIQQGLCFHVRDTNANMKKQKQKSRKTLKQRRNVSRKQN